MKTTQRQNRNAFALRRAAIARLKSERGVIILVKGSTDIQVSDAILRIDQSLAGEPSQVIRAWLASPELNTTPARTIITPKGVYSPSRDMLMASVIERIGDTPKPVSMTSRVPVTQIIPR